MGLLFEGAIFVREDHGPLLEVSLTDGGVLSVLGIVLKQLVTTTNIQHAWKTRQTSHKSVPYVLHLIFED